MIMLITIPLFNVEIYMSRHKYELINIAPYYFPRLIKYPE